MSYAPHIAFWAQCGRALTAELVGGNQERLPGTDCATIATRAIGLLPSGHGPVDMRVDSAYYAVDLLHRLRKHNARFTVSVPRNTAMWKTLTEIPDRAWTDALGMAGAQVAETTYRPGGWQHEPLRLTSAASRLGPSRSPGCAAAGALRRSIPTSCRWPSTGRSTASTATASSSPTTTTSTPPRSSIITATAPDR
jgi:hypothetical protein